MLSCHHCEHATGQLQWQKNGGWVCTHQRVQVLAAVRGPIIVCLGALLFREQVMPLQLGGYGLALVGFVWYNIAKARQMVSLFRFVCQLPPPVLRIVCAG